MVLRRFADYAAGVRDEAVPPEVVHAHHGATRT